jgi:hypothetical protein
MYSPQQDFNLDNDQFSAMNGTPHTTVGAVPVVRNNRVFYQHHRQSSFGTAATIAMSPPPSNNWFGTSLDSTSSSFGQSPPVFNNGRVDLIVSPSNSTSHLDGQFTGTEEDEGQQRK